LENHSKRLQCWFNSLTLFSAVLRSAYLLYYFDFHQAVQQESPSLPQSEVNKRISESWKRLNVAEKAYYLERARLEREGVDTVREGVVTVREGVVTVREGVVTVREGVVTVR